jgi:hypothetical protein
LCAICLDDLSTGVVKMNRCMHHYHKECITHWTRSCPMCRS